MKDNNELNSIKKEEVEKKDEVMVLRQRLSRALRENLLRRKQQQRHKKEKAPSFQKNG